MNYVELSVTVEPYNDDMADVAIAALADVGFESFTNTESGFNAYIPEKDYNEEQANIILNEINIESTRYFFEASVIPDQNWNALWESNFEPIVVDNRCTIRASFHTNLPPTDLDVAIEPKMAFGTGHHDTTYLCTLALLCRDVKDMQVLDMGCGTGILAIIAAMRGANHVDAIDIDIHSYNSTIENARVNKVEEKITAMHGDASLVPEKKYQLVVANINRNILTQDMDTYAKSMVKGASLIVSGIFTQDVETVSGAAQKNGLLFVSQNSRNGWASAEFIKP
jgi:ribosomal protein L11 methyltransferase